MKKRGISTIVATVLIVLITVAAVTILWAAISPLIDKNLSTGTSCFDVQNKLSIDANKQYTCWNVSGSADTIKIRVERAANSGTLAGLRLLIEDNGNTVPDSLLNDTTISDNELTENGKKVYSLTLASALVGDTNSLVQVSVVPRVTSEGETIDCTASQPIDIQQC